MSIGESRIRNGSQLGGCRGCTTNSIIVGALTDFDFLPECKNSTSNVKWRPEALLHLIRRVSPKAKRQASVEFHVFQKAQCKRFRLGPLVCT